MKNLNVITLSCLCGFIGHLLAGQSLISASAKDHSLSQPLPFDCNTVYPNLKTNNLQIVDSSGQVVGNFTTDQGYAQLIIMDGAFSPNSTKLTMDSSHISLNGAHLAQTSMKIGHIKLSEPATMSNIDLQIMPSIGPAFNLTQMPSSLSMQPSSLNLTDGGTAINMSPTLLKKIDPSGSVTSFKATP